MPGFTTSALVVLAQASGGSSSGGSSSSSGGGGGGNFLVTPNVGLMIWTLIAFAITLFILRRLALISGDGNSGVATKRLPSATRNGRTRHCRMTCSGIARASTSGTVDGSRAPPRGP